MDTPVQPRDQAFVGVVNARAEPLLVEVWNARHLHAKDIQVKVEFVPGNCARIALHVQGFGGDRMSWSVLVNLEDGTPDELYERFAAGVRERLLGGASTSEG